MCVSETSYRKLLSNVGCGRASAVLKLNLTRCRVDKSFCDDDDKLHPSFLKVMMASSEGGRDMIEEGWFVDLGVLCAMGPSGNWMDVVTRVASCAGACIYSSDAYQIPWLYKKDSVEEELFEGDDESIEQSCDTPDVLSEDAEVEGVVTYVEAVAMLVEVITEEMGKPVEVLVHETNVVMCDHAPSQVRLIIEVADEQLDLPYCGWDARDVDQEYYVGDNAKPYRVRAIRSPCGVCVYPARCEYCYSFFPDEWGEDKIVVDIVRCEHLGCLRTVGSYKHSVLSWTSSHTLLIADEMCERFGPLIEKLLPLMLDYVPKEEKGRRKTESASCDWCDGLNSLSPPKKIQMNFKSQFVAHGALKHVGSLDSIGSGNQRKGYYYQFKQCWCRLCSRVFTLKRRKPWLLSWAADWYYCDAGSIFYGRPKVLSSYRQDGFEYGEITRTRYGEWWTLDCDD